MSMGVRLLGNDIYLGGRGSGSKASSRSGEFASARLSEAWLAFGEAPAIGLGWLQGRLGNY
jgi:hypothetical protein